MKQTVNIDPSVAVTANIGPVSRREDVPILFRNDDGPWPSDYDFSIWNSEVKNKVVGDTSEMLDKSGNTLTLTIPAEAIVKGQHYYEIFDRAAKRVLFKGTLTVIE